jgi:hypothetical protein
MIVTEDNYQEVFDDLKSKGSDPVLFALTDKGYEKLSENNVKLLEIIIIDKANLKSYKTYYGETNQVE